MLKTLKNLNQTQRITLIVLSAALVGCLAMMAVTPARSALTYFSPEYEAEIAQTHIGVALTENGTKNVNIRSGVGDLKKSPNKMRKPREPPLSLARPTPSCCP